MDTNLKRNYFRFRHQGGIVGKDAEQALRNARTLERWNELEEQGRVRLRAEPEEEGYFDTYGEPYNAKERQAIIDQIEMNGCFRVISEYKESCEACGHDEWCHADSIGMCIYNDPLSPFENCYVIDLMASAIEQADQNVDTQTRKAG